MLTGIVFYVFAAIMVASGVLVITARNPVHSVLYLILAFFTAAGLFVLLGAEFVAMILVIVYVGAVAVLFLFVVMMLDVNFQELRAGFKRYLPIGLTVGVVLLAELALLATGFFRGEQMRSFPAVDPTVSNTHALGAVIYTDYVYVFQASGLILLVAMIGAIVLTLRSREGVKRQDIGRQLDRRREDVVAVVKVPTRGGV